MGDVKNDEKKAAANPKPDWRAKLKRMGVVYGIIGAVVVCGLALEFMEKSKSQASYADIAGVQSLSDKELAKKAEAGDENAQFVYGKRLLGDVPNPFLSGAGGGQSAGEGENAIDYDGLGKAGVMLLSAFEGAMHSGNSELATQARATFMVWRPLARHYGLPLLNDPAFSSRMRACFGE